MAKAKSYVVAPRIAVLTKKGMAHGGAKIEAKDLKCEDPDDMFKKLIDAGKVVEYVPSDAEVEKQKAKEAKAKKERAEAEKAKKDADKAKKKAEKEEAEAKKAEEEAGKK